MSNEKTKEVQSRRDFLKAVGGISALATMGGCASGSMSFGGTGAMTNFAVAPMKTIKVGFIGVGGRGTAAVRRVSLFPNVEVMALCDLRPEQVELNKKWLKENKKPGAMHEYKGKEDSWKGLCDDPDVEVVYIATPAQLHVEMELYALRAGKHVLTEVPGAQEVEECWEIIETAEKYRRHCMMLENCCYGEMEMLAWELVHKGLLGTLTHAEGGYIHNLVYRHLENNFRNRAHFNGGTVHRFGNTYPTHALGPICMYMDMNRGDCMESIVSMSSLSAAHGEYAKAKYKPEDWQNRLNWLTGDMNTSIIKTAKGRTIMMQVDMSTPRPYSRINLIQGTKGCFYDYPPRLALTKIPGEHASWLSEKQFEEIRQKYKHPLWKSTGKVAKAYGGHGGMDFIMDLRWIYCMQNGLPHDMDVYDLAAWSAIVPCSAMSDKKGGVRVDLPDFTRGGWKTAKPITIGDVDLVKMGFDPKKIEKDSSQLSV
jgi:predicted dehydrogenase